MIEVGGPGTYINDIPEGDNRERLRGEILGNVDKRSSQEAGAINRLVTYLGIICSGATIAILGYIAQQQKDGTPYFAVASFCMCVMALLSLAVCLYKIYNLHVARWSLSADIAQMFFKREASLEDVLAGNQELKSKWLYRLLFWMPFSFLTAAFTFGGLALTGFGPTIKSANLTRAVAAEANTASIPAHPKGSSATSRSVN